MVVSAKASIYLTHELHLPKYSACYQGHCVDDLIYGPTASRQQESSEYLTGYQQL